MASKANNISRSSFLLAACIASAFVLPAVASARGVIDYGILGAPTTADTNEFGGLQKTAASNLRIFSYLEVNRPKGLYDPKVPKENKINLAVAFLGFQRAMFYAAAEDAPQLVTASDWGLIRHDEFDLIMLACGGQAHAKARYGLTDKQCDTWFKANQARLQKMQEEQPARRNK